MPSSKKTANGRCSRHSDAPHREARHDPRRRARRGLAAARCRAGAPGPRRPPLRRRPRPPRPPPGRPGLPRRQPVPGRHHLRKGDLHPGRAAHPRPALPQGRRGHRLHPLLLRPPGQPRPPGGHPVLLALLEPGGTGPDRRPLLLAVRELSSRSGRSRSSPRFRSTVQPDARSWAIWPLFYRSTKFGWAAPAAALLQDRGPGRRARPTASTAASTSGTATSKAGSALDLLFPLFVSSRRARPRLHLCPPAELLLAAGRTGRTCWPCPCSTGPAGPTAAPPSRCWGTATRSARTGPARSSGCTGTAAARRAATTCRCPCSTGAGTRTAAPWARRSATSRATGATAGARWPGCTGSGARPTARPTTSCSRRSGASARPSRTPRSCRRVLHLRRPSYTLTTVFPLYWAGRDPQRGTRLAAAVPALLLPHRRRRAHLLLGHAGGRLPARRRAGDPHAHAAACRPSSTAGTPGASWTSCWASTGATATRPTAPPPTCWAPFTGGRTARARPPPCSRCSGTSATPASGATAHSAAAALFPPQLARRDPDRRRASSPCGATTGATPTAAGARGCSRWPSSGSGPTGATACCSRCSGTSATGQGSTTVAAPFFFRFADRNQVSMGIPPAALLLRRASGSDRYHVQFPLFWRFSDGATGVSTTVVPPAVRAQRAARIFGRAVPAAVRRQLERPRALRALPAVLALPGPADRPLLDGGAQLPLPAARRRDHPRAVPPAALPQRGPPGRQARDQLHPVPAGPLPPRPPTAGSSSAPSRVAARTPQTRAGFIPPYFWYQDRNVAASGVPPLYFDITRLDTQRAHPHLRSLGQRRHAPARRRGCCSRCSAATPTSESGGPGSSRPSSAGASTADRARATRSTPSCRCSGTHARPATAWRWWAPGTGASGPEGFATGLVPLYFYAHNGDRRFLATPLFFRRENFKEGTSRLFAAFLFYRSTRPQGHTTVLFPLLWAGRNGGPQPHGACSRWPGCSGIKRTTPRPT